MRPTIAALAATLLLAAPLRADEPREEDVRLLEVTLDDAVLSDALAGYASEAGGTLLPLGALSELLGIAIKVDAGEGRASGFVLEERRTFTLDVGRRNVSVGGKPRRFDRELVRVYSDDIYVDATLLGDWLPVAFDVDLFSLRVNVRPREPLPLQQRLERERRIRHWRLRLPPPDPGYPRVATGYRAFDLPFVDQTLRLALGAESSTASFSTYATGDLLFMESETYLAGDHGDPLDQARVTLRRRDPAGAVGGFLHATEFAVGHVLHPTSALLASTSEPSPGVLLTNLPLQRAAEFDRHSFHGNLPPGWDVELYHNGALVDYQQSRADGQYVFENVPLLFGMNFFRLVFHGPQGQRREEDRRFLLGESLTQRGHFEYRVVANVESETTRRASTLLSYGISRHLTATGELASLPAFDGERRYGKFGLRTFWSALFAYGDYASDDTGGRAWEAGLQTRILGVNVAASRTELSGGFASDAFRFVGDPLVSRDRVRVDTAIPAWVLPRIPLSVEVERQRLASGVLRTVVQSRMSANYKGLSISNRLFRTTTSGQPSQMDAALQFSRYIRGVGLRGELLYMFAPVQLTAANFVVERQFANGYRLFANVSRSFLGAQHTYAVGIDKTTGSFAAGVDARRGADGKAGANVNLSAGIDRDPRSGTWAPNARSRAPFGALSPRVFLDRNLSGTFDAGDELLRGVGFTVDGMERVERTDANGVTHLSELSPHDPADVAIDVKTLDDPQWVPNVAGVRIVPRPGKAALIDFPVIATAEIEGLVTTTRRGRNEAAGGVVVELVDAAGKVVQQTKSAYDGVYVLPQVRPGRYEVRVAGSARHAVEVRNGQSLIAGINFGGAAMPGAAPPAPPVAVARAVPDAAKGAGAPPKPVVEAATPAPVAQGKFVVQLGAFSIERNALALLRRVPAARISHRGALYFVEAGPFRSRDEAAATRETLRGRGIEGIVRGGP